MLLPHVFVIPSVASQLVLVPAKPEGGEFRFSLGATESVAQTPTQGSKSVLSAQTAHYTLLLDWNEIENEDYGYFRYPFYVRRSQERASTECDAASECRRYLMKGIPVGSFQDQQIEVPFTIGPGEEGSIFMPVFSFSSSSFLSGPTWAKSENVYLSSGGEIHISLTNKSNLPVSVSFRQPILRGDYWQDAKLLLVSDKSQTIQIAPGATLKGPITLKLVPRPFKAFLSSMFSFARRSIDDCGGAPSVSSKQWMDDCATVEADYQVRGGPPRTLAVLVPVRFEPWPPLLFVAVILGAGIGLSINALAKRQQVRSTFRKDFAFIVLIGVLAEALSMVLVSLKSEFRILGLDLDPFQLLPALLIGALIGLLGFEGCKSLATWFSGLMKPPSGQPLAPPAPRAADGGHGQ